MADITVQCSVCGRHDVTAPARPGRYRVKCLNADELNIKWEYSATVITVDEDGSASSKQGSPGD